MHLEKFSLAGHRAIPPETPVELKLSDLTLIVGPHGSCKTPALRMMREVWFPVLNERPDDTYKYLGFPIRGSLKVSFENEEEEEIIDEFVRTVLMSKDSKDSQRMKAVKELVDLIKKQIVESDALVQTWFSPEEVDEEYVKRLLEPFTKIYSIISSPACARSVVEAARYVLDSYVKRKGVERTYMISLEGKFVISELLLGGKLPEEFSSTVMEALASCEVLSKALEARRYKKFAVENASKIAVLLLNVLLTVISEKVKLVDFNTRLHFLKNEVPLKVWSELVGGVVLGPEEAPRLFKYLSKVSDYEKVRTLSEGEKLMIELYDKVTKEWVSLDKASSGIAASVPALLALASAKRGDVVLIDDVEFLLTHWAQKELMEIVRDALKRGVQVVMVTKSPVIVEEAKKIGGMMNVMYRSGKKVVAESVDLKDCTLSYEGKRAYERALGK